MARTPLPVSQSDALIHSLEMVAIADLKPHYRNDGRHPPDEIAHLKASIAEHGIDKNVVVANDGTILTGHGVVQAARELGYTQVPVCRKPYGPDDLLALGRLVGDNHIARLRQQDDAVLQALLEDIAKDDPAALLGTGFDEAMLAALAETQGTLGGEEHAGRDAEPQVDRAAELQHEWGTEVGQLWALGDHRLVVGDCMDKAVVDRLLDGREIEAVITDPPYGLAWDTDYTRFTHNRSKQRHYPSIMYDNEAFDPTPWLGYPKVILWGANWYCQHIPLGSWLVWDKRHASGAAMLSDAELAWMKGKRGVSLYAETVQGLIRKERSMHPTQKPVGLMEWCLTKADVEIMCLDPYLGSGTTLIACENLGRSCYGAEISPAYTAVCLQRYYDLVGERPVLLES